MNWAYYSKLLDEKVADAWYNWEQAEKKVRQAKAAYESAMREKKSFEEAIENKLIDVNKERPSY